MGDVWMRVLNRKTNWLKDEVPDSGYSRTERAASSNSACPLLKESALAVERSDRHTMLNPMSEDRLEGWMVRIQDFECLKSSSEVDLYVLDIDNQRKLQRSLEADEASEELASMPARLFWRRKSLCLLASEVPYSRELAQSKRGWII